MSSRHKQNRNRSRPQNSSAIPNVYPPIPGYSMPTPQWLPPHPGTNYPHQWYQPWANMPPLNNQNVTWLPPTTSVANTSDFPSPKSGVPTENPDEYTVDALRRIYNNDDGSIEIQRVKLQRKPGNGTKQNCIDYHSGSQSLVPVSPDILNERRPPPRKHKRKETQVNVDMEKKQDGLPPQGWYPYMSYLPQPFPYPYPYGYVWPMPPPPPSTVTVPARCQSPTDDSDCSISRQETFPVSAESPDKSRSPELQRPSSSAATSHVTESLGTDIAPSDSVSMRGFKRETSLERILRTSLSGSKQSDRPASDDMEKTKEWMEDMQKAFESKSGQPSDIAGDRSSFATAPSDIPTPPTRTKTKRESDSHKKITRRKSNSESNIDNPDEQRSSVSLPLFESTRVSDSDLIYAFKKLEHASGVFKAHASSGLSKNEHLEGDIRRRKTSREDGRCSRTSTLSFHSTRQSADENPVDTDSTDIAIPNDSSTADESIENFDESRAIDDIREDNYKWVLQQTGDISDNLQGHEEKPTDNLIENWRTEVSLWRARLVVSLCRGQGLDQQDWATFQLLVQHPLPMNLKLSLLHAHRICSQNYDVGVSMLRNALLHLTTFGETLMKPESERPSGWRTIAIEADQPWAPVKGSLEILRVLGFYVREDGALKYKRKQSPEISVIARLTLDLLVLAEEFRLFLTGAHQYPMNITQLFTPRDSHGDMHIAAIHQSEQHPNTHHNSVVVEQEDGRDAGSAIDRSDVEVVFEAPEQKLSDEKDIGKRGSKNAKRRPTPLPPSEALLHFSSTSLGEVDTLHSASENFSPQPSDTLSSSTSLPDLQSPSQASCLKLDSHKKESGSRETLTSTPTLEISEDKTLEQSNAEEGEKSIVEDKDQNESKSKRLSRRINGKDNPEDHIYEEIGDIKTQVEDLRERDSVSQSPPPLPPKTKSSTQNQEIYPNTEWSVSSQYSSVHSGSGVRKKKRKAPMPPELFTSDENETGKDVTMINENINNAFDSPIIEKDKRESEKPSHGNPFYEEKIKPAGYVGKNPFYEDLNKNISKKQTTESKTSKVDQQKEKVVPSVTFSRTSNEDVSEISESFSLPAGVRPQRRKDKGSTLKKTQNDSIKRIQNEIISVSNDDKSSENGSSASVITLKHVDSELPQEPLKTQDKPRPHATKPHEQKPHTKNDTGDHQCDPQVVVPIRNTETEGRKEVKDKISNKKDIILQKISITYDITIDDSDLPRDEVSDPSATEQNDVSKGTTPETSENKGTETSLVADEVGNDSSTVPKDSALNKATELPPVPPPKAALRLLDDIPYIDTNDVKSYKNSYTLFNRKQPPHYGLSEIRPQEVTNFSVSTAEEKVSTFLKRSSLVPFIDESDVPPDSPPPPPPLPPPSTPPLFLPIPLPLPPSTPPHLPPTPPPFPPPTPPPLPPPTPPFALHPSPPVDRLLPSIQVSLANQSSPLGGKDETQTLSEKSGESDIGSKISSTSDEKTTKEDVKTPEVSPELNASDMDYHSEHKDMILFETEVRLRTPDPYTAASEADRYEIPEPPKTEADVEERYEIPDVTRASASANASSHAKISETKEIFAKRREVEAAKKSKEGCLPKRPPRHQLSLKAPPRPPKPNEIDVPPKLPPKTSSLKSSTSPSVSPGHTTSLPSTLVKAYSSDRSSNKKVSPLSPVSSPSHTSARGPVSRSKSNTPKASSLSSIPTGIGINKGTEPSSPSIPHSTFKTLPRATYPPNKSVSMPSSPKVLKYPSKAPKQEEKKQKSWPFLLCDCVYATSSNEDVKYVVK